MYCSGDIGAGYSRIQMFYSRDRSNPSWSSGCSPPSGDSRNAIVLREVLHNDNIRIVPIINVPNNLKSRVCVCACARAWSVTVAARREKSPAPRLYYYYYIPFVCWWESIFPVIYNFGNFCFGGAVVGSRTTTIVIGGGAVAGGGRGSGGRQSI